MVLVNLFPLSLHGRTQAGYSLQALTPVQKGRYSCQPVHPSFSAARSTVFNPIFVLVFAPHAAVAQKAAFTVLVISPNIGRISQSHLGIPLSLPYRRSQFCPRRVSFLRTLHTDFMTPPARLISIIPDVAVTMYHGNKLNVVKWLLSHGMSAYMIGTAVKIICPV